MAKPKMSGINNLLDTGSSSSSYFEAQTTPKEPQKYTYTDTGQEGEDLEEYFDTGKVGEDLEKSFSSQCQLSDSESFDFGSVHSSTLEFNDFMELKITALDLEEKFLTTGCPNIDKFLNGGVPSFGLTEFVGPSGMGKTQIALQLSLTAQLPEELGGLNAGAVYISTEGLFPSSRLAQLSQHFKTKYGSNLPDNPMDNVLLRHALDTGALLHCISELPAVFNSRKIGLLVVDSIAATFRSEYENDIAARTRDLRLVGRALHDIAFLHKIVLVCLNQVAGTLSSTDGQDFAPSLGVAWRSLVTNRIVLSRKNDKRWLEVPFSCYIPVRSIQFDVGAEGVFSNEEFVSNISVRDRFSRKK